VNGSAVNWPSIPDYAQDLGMGQPETNRRQLEELLANDGVSAKSVGWVPD
jgi:hypothetical protein